MTFHRHALSIALLPLLLGLSATADAVILRGTIGKQPVVADFDFDSVAEVSGRYFNSKDLLDIKLSGTRESENALRFETKPRAGGAAEHWRLERKGEELIGQLESGDGRKLPVRLRRIEEEDVPEASDPVLEEMRKDDLFEYLRVSELKLTRGQTETFGGHRVQWWEEPRSKVRMVEVLSGYDAATLTRVNRILRTRQWETVSTHFYCMSSPGSSSTVKTTLRLMDDRFVSISRFTEFACDGEPANSGDAVINFDVRNGEDLTLEDVLWLGKGEPPSKRDSDDGKRYRAYRSAERSPWIVAALVKLYPDKMAADSETCNYKQPSGWDKVTWSMTPQGLLVSPFLPRNVRSCEYPGWATIPWKQVEAHSGKALKR